MVYEIQKQALMQKYFGNETELKEEVQMSSSKRSTIIVEHLRKAADVGCPFKGQEA